MGYEKIVAIYDGDRKKEAEDTELEFPNYKFIVIREDDIRDKKVRTIQEKKELHTLTVS